MKNFVLVCVMCLVLIIPAMAENGISTVEKEKNYLEIINDVLKNVPVTFQGAFYNPIENKYSYISMIELVNYKNIVSFQGGVNFSNSNIKDNSMMFSLTCPIVGLKKFGFDVPILNLMELNLGVGCGVYDFNKSHEKIKFRFGLAGTIIKVKF